MKITPLPWLTAKQFKLIKLHGITFVIEWSIPKHYTIFKTKTKGSYNLISFLERWYFSSPKGKGKQIFFRLCLGFEKAKCLLWLTRIKSRRWSRLELKAHFLIRILSLPGNHSLVSYPTITPHKFFPSPNTLYRTLPKEYRLL